MAIGGLSSLSGIDLRSLDVKNLGRAPMPVQIGAAVVLACALVGAGYYLDTSDQIDKLRSVEAKEPGLRSTFETKAKRAANLEEYKVQLAEMEKVFGELLRQLPSQTEIPGLIVDISQTALASGLEINLFKPKPEEPKGFYAEKPIQITIKGSYHQMGNFVTGVSALPRIVTLHEVNLKPDGPLLSMSLVAKTYRYLDEGR